MEAQYEYRKHLYTIFRCTDDMVDSHIAYNKAVWESTGCNVELQKKRMLQAVKDKHAYYMNRDNKLCSFLYYEKDNVFNIAIAYWTNTYRALYIGMGFLKYIKNISILNFIPHDIEHVAYERIVHTIIPANKHNSLCWVDFEDYLNKYKLHEIYDNAKLIKV